MFIGQAFSHDLQPTHLSARWKALKMEGWVLGGDLAHPDPARLLEPAVLANTQQAGVAAPVALDASVEGLRPETQPFEDAHVLHLAEPLVVEIIDVTDT